MRTVVSVATDHFVAHQDRVHSGQAIQYLPANYKLAQENLIRARARLGWYDYKGGGK